MFALIVLFFISLACVFYLGYQYSLYRHGLLNGKQVQEQTYTYEDDTYEQQPIPAVYDEWEVPDIYREVIVNWSEFYGRRQNPHGG